MEKIKVWERKKIRDLDIKIIDGDRGKNYPHQEDMLDQGDCLFLNAGNLSEGNFDFTNSKFVSKERDLLMGKGKLKKYDIVLTTRGTVGRYAFYSDDLEFNDVRINSGMAIIRNLDKRFYTEYILAFMKSESFKKEILRVVFGSAQPQLTIDIIKNFKIPVPSLSEQKRIVSMLEIFDGYLKVLGEEVKAKKNIKKHLMKVLLLGDLRLKGFNKEWKTYELGQILKYEQPGKYIVKDTDYINNGIPVLTANKSFILGYTDEKEGIYDKLPVIIFDDFTTLSKFVDFPFKVKSSAMKILKPKSNEFDIKFIYERMQLLKYVVGEHKRCYLSEYQYLDIKVPEIKEQQAIASILSSADKEIETLEAKKKLVEQQRKYLLNNLITGNIRVPETIGNNLN